MSDPSPAYFEALKATRELHATSKKFNGRFLMRYADEVGQLVREHGCKTLLDYGCGKGIQWNEPIPDTDTMLADLLGVTPTLYDPGWKPYAKEPRGTFDMVVVTQVLGSIPIFDLPWALERIYGYAEKVVYVGERIKPLKKQHLAHMASQMPHEKPHEWWADTLRQVKPDGPTVILKTFDSVRSTARQERIW